MDISIDIKDVVIFKYYCDILKNEDLMDGNIIYQRKDDNNQDLYSISYLEGYRSSNIEVTKDKIIAVIDNNKNKENYKHIYINDDSRFRGYFIDVKAKDNLIFNKCEVVL